MAMNGLDAQIKKMKYLNTSDADIASAFLTNPSKQVVVTWKPLVSQIVKAKDVKVVFAIHRRFRARFWTCWWCARKC